MDDVRGNLIFYPSRVNYVSMLVLIVIASPIYLGEGFVLGIGSGSQAIVICIGLGITAILAIGARLGLILARRSPSLEADEDGLTYQRFFGGVSRLRWDDVAAVLVRYNYKGWNSITFVARSGSVGGSIYVADLHLNFKVDEVLRQFKNYPRVRELTDQLPS